MGDIATMVDILNTLLDLGGDTLRYWTMEHFPVIWDILRLFFEVYEDGTLQ